MASERTDGLEIEQDLAFQRRSWAIQRVGWGLMAAVLALALAGALGSGPLSRDEAALPGQLRLEYQRLARYQSPETLTVRLEPAATAGSEVHLWIDRAFVDGAKLESITPPPVRVAAAGDRLVYVFSIGRPGEPATITFHMQPERLGPGRGRIGLADRAESLPLWQFVYP